MVLAVGCWLLLLRSLFSASIAQLILLSSEQSARHFFRDRYHLERSKSIHAFDFFFYFDFDNQIKMDSNRLTFVILRQALLFCMFLALLQSRAALFRITPTRSGSPSTPTPMSLDSLLLLSLLLSQLFPFVSIVIRNSSSQTVFRFALELFLAQPLSGFLFSWNKPSTDYLPFGFGILVYYS